MLVKQAACALSFLIVFGVLSVDTALAQDSAPEQTSEFVVVGYLPEYRLQNIVQQRLVGITDLIYFGIEPSIDGGFPESINAQQLKKLAEIKQTLGCRLLLTVGGWERSAGFVQLTEDAAVQTKFINELNEFCQANGFDGVDYDWEHPRGSAEIQRYEQLISETKAVFSPHELLVTVALASWQDLGASAYQSVDRVHLMSYDHPFPQATLEKTRDDIQKLLGRGCPASKIAVGIPFYGRSKSGHAKRYAELVSKESPETDVTDGYAFNSKSTVARKLEIAKQQRLSGVMIWELGQDATDDQNSLLKFIIDAIAR